MMSDWYPEDGWHIEAAKSFEERQLEAHEELMGYQGKGRGHKPPRADIQKYKDAYDEYHAYERGRKTRTPTQLEQMSDLPEQKDAAQRWIDKTAMTQREQAAVDLYKRMYVNAHDMNLGIDDPAQYAFVELVRMITTSPDWAREERLDPMTERVEPGQAKKLVGGSLKKWEYSQYPKLYSAIADTVGDLYRRSSDENDTTKLWPWAVSELKRQFAGQSDPRHLGIWDEFNWPTIGTRWPGPPRDHLVDIVDQTGGLLHRLGQENRTPQGVDANNFKSLGDMEQWLYEYRRSTGEGDDGGKTVHKFPDAWTVKQLTQPNQLQWEGDEMNHCVGGYWQPVRDGRSFIYSIRDHENKPTATLEFKPSDSTTMYERVGDATDADLDAQREKDKEQGYAYTADQTRVLPEYESPEHFEQNRATWEDHVDDTADLHADDKDYLKRHGPKPPKFGFFHGTKRGPFEEAKGQLYKKMPGSMNSTNYEAVVPAESGEEKQAILAQHMGPGDSMPNSTANTHIRDWLDHHRNNGWQIKRSDDFYWPNGWDESGHGAYPAGWYDADCGEVAGIRNHRRENTGAANMLSDWYSDHFRQNPARWTGQHDEEAPVDKYGFPLTDSNDENGLMRVDWDDVDDDVLRTTADNYDRDVSRERPEPLARAYWHAFHLDDPLPENADQKTVNRHKEAMQKRIEDWEEKLSGYSMNDWDYAREHHLPEIREKYEQLGGPIPFESENPGYDLDNDDSVDEDKCHEAEDHFRYENEANTYGGCYKFINYLAWLNHLHGPMTNRQLHEHAVNGTFPKYTDVVPPTPEPDGTIPGALSHVATEVPDWMVQHPQGQWYKWGYHPNYGALLWPVTGPDGDKDDRMADRSHIDYMNKAWARPGRYPFDPADQRGVAFHNPEQNRFYVTQYPMGASGELATHVWPYLQQQIMQQHPSAQIDWPTEVGHLHRTSDFEPTPTYNDNLSQAFRYDPESDQVHWGSGHGVIDARLYQMGLGPQELRRMVAGRWRPEGRVEFHRLPELGAIPQDESALRERILQEASQRPWEQSSGPSKPWMASVVEHPDPEFAGLMRRAYAGEDLITD